MNDDSEISARTDISKGNSLNPENDSVVDGEETRPIKRVIRVL
jgi:hypothetical protein